MTPTKRGTKIVQMTERGIETDKQKIFDVVRLKNQFKTDYGAQAPKPLYEGQYTIPFFHFSPEAQPFFHNWLENLEKKFRSSDHPMIQQHLSKYRSLMPSLALIFHIVGMADGGRERAITLASAQKAAAWCDYLETHARRIYGIVLDTIYESSPTQFKSDELLAWMRKQFNHRNQPLKRRDILRYSKFRSSKELDPMLSDLVQMGHLREGPQNSFSLIS